MTFKAILRFTIEAFRSSPIKSIRNLALKPPFDLRLIEKSLLYVANIKRNTNNPANKYISKITKYGKDHGMEFNTIMKVQPHNFPHGPPNLT